MKTGGYLKRKTPLRPKTPLVGQKTRLRRTKLHVVGHSPVSELKREIQALVREIVILRDGGCILRDKRRCNGEIGRATMQADHLITRANSATFADTRLIVYLCQPCHGGYKKWHKEEYDALVKSILPASRVALWNRCEVDSWRPNRKYSIDWKNEIANLKQELNKLKQNHV